MSACNAGDPGSIPGLGRSSGEGNGNPLQYACLENFMDGGAWWATVHGVTKSWTWLSNFSLSHIYLLSVVYLKFKFDGGVMYLWASKVAWVVKNLPANAEDRRCRLDPWVGKSPWRGAWQLTLVLLPGASHGQRTLAGYVHWVAKGWTQLKELSRHEFIFAKSGNPELAGKSKILWLYRMTVIELIGGWGQRIRSHSASAMDFRE